MAAANGFISTVPNTLTHSFVEIKAEMTVQTAKPSLLDQFMNNHSILNALDEVEDEAFADDEEPLALPLPVATSNNGTAVKIDETVDDEVYGGFYQQRDQTIENTESFEEGIEVITLKDALSKYPWFGRSDCCLFHG